MSPIQAVKTALRKYFVFSGRARRSEFWWFQLFATVVGVVATGVDISLFGPDLEDPTPVSTVLGLALLLPSLTVTVRRLHDISHSGWWILILLVPLAGLIALIVLTASNTNADNRYGPSPKGPQATAIRPG